MLTIGQENEFSLTNNVCEDAFKTMETILKNIEKTGEFNNLTKEELIEEELLLMDQLDLEETLFNYTNYQIQENNLFNNKFTSSNNNRDLLDEKLLNNRKEISIM
ncbi:hypothetical protein [Methanosphaera sp.]